MKKAILMDLKTLIIAVAILLVVTLIILGMSGKLPILEGLFGDTLG